MKGLSMDLKFDLSKFMLWCTGISWPFCCIAWVKSNELKIGSGRCVCGWVVCACVCVCEFNYTQQYSVHCDVCYRGVPGIVDTSPYPPSLQLTGMLLVCHFLTFNALSIVCFLWSCVTLEEWRIVDASSGKNPPDWSQKIWTDEFWYKDHD